MQTDPQTPADLEAQTAADVDAHARAVLPGEPLPLGEHTFRVRPMKVRQMFPFLHLARPLFAALVARPASPPAGLPPQDAPVADQGGNAPATLDVAIQDATWLLDVLDQHGAQVIRALAVGIESDQAPEAQAATVAMIEDLELPHLVTLLKFFVVVNASFFAQQGMRLPTGPMPLAPLAQVVAGAASPATP